jgi:uncharacterized protein (TIGR02996 family)
MTQPNHLATNPTLEAAIRANREDPGPYLVYADWLQSQGSPLGELIVLQHALDAGDDVGRRERAEAIILGFEFPDVKLATFGWRRGLWTWLRLENQKDWMDSTFDARDLARRVFASPACRVLDELRLGVLRWEENYDDVPAVLEEAGKHEWAAGITRLHLGDLDRDIDMAHHVIGDVGALITQHFPNLRWLKLHSGDQSWSTTKETFGIAGLELVELAELTIETCSMSKQRTAALLEAKLPKLAKLELWFGSEDQNADTEIDDLAPLLAGTTFPAVRHLGLRNAAFADDLARTVPASRIAARLESLDLSMGTMGDEAAIELAESASHLPELETLDVSDNFLTEASLGRLRSVFPGLISKSQKEIDGDYRYVSVGE